MAPEVVRARRHILRFRGSAALLVRLWFVAGSAEGSAASREPMVLRADPQAIRMAVDLVNSLNTPAVVRDLVVWRAGRGTATAVIITGCADS